MREKLFLKMILCIGIIFIFSGVAGAVPEGQPCMAEPTDEFISYGEVRTCSISPVGDSDLFRFVGATGEVIVVQATEVSGSPEACIALYRPDGTVLSSTVCGETSATITTTLDQAGEHTIRVTEQSNNQGMSYTVVLERISPTSPAAIPINSGEILGESIDPTGDIDLYSFQGSAGDNIILTATEVSGSPEACIALYRPDGTVLSSTVCGETSATITTTLDQAGEHTIRVTEQSNNQGMTYNLEYQCLFGSCPQLTRPICDIQMNQAVYVDDDTVTASVFRIANPGPDGVPVELKVWLKIPTFPTIQILNVGADGSFILPSGFEMDLGPINFFTVSPTLPLGDYEFGCRMLDPVTGKLKTLDINPFEVQ